MRILTVDVGTGTQDVLLFDSDREIENCFKMVMPSPTAAIAENVRATTQAGASLLLRGVTMGGGPSHWATMDHVRAGLPTYATAEAAQTFDDDLAAVREMGIAVVSEDEATSLAKQANTVTIELRDFWLAQILDAFRAFGVNTHLDAIAVAVFDHGAAPPGVSDRIFRFDYLRSQLAAGRGLAGFGFERGEIPPSMTRLQAVTASAPSDLPLFAMDTAPAAVLGALDDKTVRGSSSAIVANVGNFHCLAFHLEGGRAVGLFEHHTGELTAERLRTYVEQLGEGTIDNAVIFADKGHGALVLDPSAQAPSFIAVTGPRRQLLIDGGIAPYLAVPHGDMMLAGNFGLLRGFAARNEHVAEAVERQLGPPPSAATSD